VRQCLLLSLRPALTDSFFENSVNDDMSGETFTFQDALFRALLQQKNEPAVIKVSFPQLTFPDLIRGAFFSVLFPF
jgi:hypothetical protein